MHHTTRTLCFLAAAMAVFSACKKEEAPEPRDLGYGYYPKAVGSWVEYQVDSTWRDDALTIRDTVSYLLREKITEHYTDPEGRPCQRIARYVLNDANEWVVRDIWTSTVTATGVEKTEENERRLKLIFAVEEGDSWDINVFNTVGKLEVAYRDVDEPWQTGSMTFDSTLIVRNTVGPNQVEKRNFEERYAKNVGLVEKYWEESNSQYVQLAPPPAAPVLQVKGFRLDMVVTAYGQD